MLPWRCKKQTMTLGLYLFRKSRFIVMAAELEPSGGVKPNVWGSPSVWGLPGREFWWCRHGRGNPFSGLTIISIWPGCELRGPAYFLRLISCWFTLVSKSNLCSSVAFHSVSRSFPIRKIDLHFFPVLASCCELFFVLTWSQPLPIWIAEDFYLGLKET